MGFKVKDIAAELNLSPATVSLVINRRPGISEPTRERVYKALEAHGFQDALGRVRHEKKALQLIIFHKKSSSVAYSQYFSKIFSGVLEGIDVQARALGYNLMVTYADEDTLRESQPSGAEGILLLATDMEARYMKPLTKSGLPVVVIDNFYDMESADCVTINNHQGVFKAVRYLNDMGHRQIGYIHSLVESHNFSERAHGYRRAMEKCGLEVSPAHIFSVGIDYGQMTEELKALFEKSESLPTALFADNDILAMHAVKALAELNLRVPEDISIVGFDDMPLSEMLQPPLTTIGVAKNLMGALAVRRLEELLQTKDNTHTCKIETAAHLVERESVRRISNK